VIVGFGNDEEIEAGIERLPRFANLRDISLGGKVTNAGLESIAKCDLGRNVTLSLHAPRISDRGLRHILDCDWITTLWINGARVSPDGIKLLAGMEHLECIGLLQEGRWTATRIRDEEIAALAGMNHLTKLFIIGPDVTDESIPALGTLSSLKTLSLLNTQITDEGLSRLQQRIPACTIAVRRDTESFTLAGVPAE